MESLCVRRKNVDCPIRFEFDNTVTLRKKGKIITPPNVKTRPKTAASLPHNNASGFYKLAAEYFDAKPFGI